MARELQLHLAVAMLLLPLTTLLLISPSSSTLVDVVLAASCATNASNQGTLPGTAPMLLLLVGRQQQTMRVRQQVVVVTGAGVGEAATEGVVGLVRAMIGHSSSSSR